jgi:hypothetical protein
MLLQLRIPRRRSDEWRGFTAYVRAVWILATGVQLQRNKEWRTAP